MQDRDHDKLCCSMALMVPPAGSISVFLHHLIQVKQFEFLFHCQSLVCQLPIIMSHPIPFHHSKSYGYCAYQNIEARECSLRHKEYLLFGGLPKVIVATCHWLWFSYSLALRVAALGSPCVITHVGGITPLSILCAWQTFLPMMMSVKQLQFHGFFE